MDNLFSTHPATENRIAALRDLARSMGGQSFTTAAPAGPWSQARKRGPWG
jgi:heat shock protein HtpX